MHPVLELAVLTGVQEDSVLNNCWDSISSYLLSFEMKEIRASVKGTFRSGTVLVYSAKDWYYSKYILLCSVFFFFDLPFSFCRLILSYERTYNDEKLNFCLGHNPAVTITFVCPSKRGEEVTLMF